MTIGELSAQTGVPASTIRYWERIGVLPKAVRIRGRRRYGTEAMERIAVMRLGQACGFRLDELRPLLSGTPSVHWRRTAEQKRQELAEWAGRLRNMQRLVERVANCQCGNLSECARVAAEILPHHS